MPFSSLNFWLVLPFVFVLYWLIPARYNQWKKVFLGPFELPAAKTIAI